MFDEDFDIDSVKIRSITVEEREAARQQFPKDFKNEEPHNASLRKSDSKGSSSAEKHPKASTHRKATKAHSKAESTPTMESIGCLLCHKAGSLSVESHLKSVTIANNARQVHRNCAVWSPYFTELEDGEIVPKVDASEWNLQKVLA
jgi:hypothetical protein